MIGNSKTNTSAENIVLVSPQRWSTYMVPPMSFIELAAYLRSRNTPVSILDIKRTLSMIMTKKIESEIEDEIIERLSDLKPDWVGLPVYTVDYWAVMNLAKRLKQRLTGVKIVVGSVHATARPNDFLFADSPIDVVCIGEGEEVLYELLNRNKLGLYYENIQGIAFFDGQKMQRTPSRQLTKDLSHLPPPAYDMVDMEFYVKPQQMLIRRLILRGTYIYTGRGCPYQCSFCASSMLYETQGLKRIVRYRPIEQIVDTLLMLKNTYEIDSFYILDDTFTITESRVYKFCDLYESKGLKMPWACDARVNQATVEMLTKMKHAGCKQLDFGVESGSDESLKRMHKGITTEQIYKAFDLCRTVGMRSFANLMFNTPGETEEDVRLSLECIKKIKANELNIGLTIPFLGTPLFAEYIGDNFTIEDYHIYEDPNLYTKIVDKRFKLSKHNMDSEKLLRQAYFKYILLKRIVPVTLEPWYWKIVLTSPRRLSYLKFMIQLWKSIFLRYSFYIRHNYKRIFKFTDNQKDSL